jgi:predicted transcriptional regulator
MRKISQPRPTDAELEILRVLWDQGPSTVRDVHERMNSRKPTGYTTVLKLMQIMTDKELVRRNEDERAHVYQAEVPRETTQRQLVDDLMERAFGGSAPQLVMQALASKRATPEELARIRYILDEFERGAQ